MKYTEYLPDAFLETFNNCPHLSKEGIIALPDAGGLTFFDPKTPTDDLFAICMRCPMYQEHMPRMQGVEIVIKLIDKAIQTNHLGIYIEVPKDQR